MGVFRKFLTSVRANILVGFLLTVPVIATFIIFDFLFKLTTDWLPKEKITVIPEYMITWGKGYPFRIVTLLAVLLALYGVGLLTRNIMGRRLYRFADRFLTQVPVIRGIYIASRQVSEALFTQRKTLFKEVVLVQYPRKGLYSVAFVTAQAPGIITAHMAGDDEQDCVSLFIPTTPNPTSGLMILAPRSELVRLNVPVAEALTYVVSAGAVAPGAANLSGPTLLDKLESWLRHGDDTKKVVPVERQSNE